MAYRRKIPLIPFWPDWVTLLKNVTREQKGRILDEALNSAQDWERHDLFEDDPGLMCVGNFVIEQIMKYRTEKQAEFDRKQKPRNKTEDIFPPRFP